MKGITIFKKPNLTKGQKSLFEVICLKLEKGDVLTFSEAKEIYINNVNREMRNGVPYFFNWWWRNEKDEMVGRLEPMSKEQINIAVITWLTHNIGCLVLKGYLKILPVLELNK